MRKGFSKVLDASIIPKDFDMTIFMAKPKQKEACSFLDMLNGLAQLK